MDAGEVNSQPIAVTSSSSPVSVNLGATGNLNRDEDNFSEESSEQASAQHSEVQQQEWATTNPAELVTTLRLTGAPYKLSHIWHHRVFQVTACDVDRILTNLANVNYIIQALQRSALADPGVFSSISCRLDGNANIQGWVYHLSPPFSNQEGEVYFDTILDMLKDCCCGHLFF